MQVIVQEYPYHNNYTMDFPLGNCVQASLRHLLLQHRYYAVGHLLYTPNQNHALNKHWGHKFALIKSKASILMFWVKGSNACAVPATSFLLGKSSKPCKLLSLLLLIQL